MPRFGWRGTSQPGLGNHLIGLRQGRLKLAGLEEEIEYGGQLRVVEPADGARGLGLGCGQPQACQLHKGGRTGQTGLGGDFQQGASTLRLTGGSLGLTERCKQSRVAFAARTSDTVGEKRALDPAGELLDMAPDPMTCTIARWYYTKAAKSTKRPTLGSRFVSITISHSAPPSRLSCWGHCRQGGQELFEFHAGFWVGTEAEADLGDRGSGVVQTDLMVE